MPSIIFNGEHGTEPHFSKEIVTDQANFKVWLISEKERILADIPAFEADLESDDPELRLGAENNIWSINRKVEKLQIAIDSI